jgi:hypothetical protein
MTENKFGWRVGDGLRWSSPEGDDKNCVVIKTTAMMIEFETEEDEVKRVKGNNPKISRIDGPPKAEPISDSVADLQVADDCASKAKAAPVSPAAEEKISERKAELDLNSGGVAMASIQIREGGALQAGDQEFRIDGGKWYPSLEEALDAEYGKGWMCIRWRDGL